MIGVIINLKKLMTIEKSNIFEITKAFSGQRLDNFLIKKLKGLPKNLIYKLVRSGQVRVNKGRAKVSYRIQESDLIRVPPYLLKDELISNKIQTKITNAPNPTSAAHTQRSKSSPTQTKTHQQPNQTQHNTSHRNTTERNATKRNVTQRDATQ